jgi:acetoin:2,6-dichlorophenolindophenol oxidoreductase subunit beta
MCGASAEILAQVVERFQGRKDIRVQRIGFAPVPCPTAKHLENEFYPNAGTLAEAAYALAHDGRKQREFPKDLAPEIVQFKGPF